ncbi:MAG: ferredoxin-NADP reductase [Candidatus Azotimanducaceae bacterium]|jgi:ferredoxin-NADP reductase/predicted pyridoxine 5'-phosphate oxidase superfamily flavin-nucleotide-binding protein
MGHQFAALAFTPTVRDLQTSAGSRASYAAMDQGDDYNYELSEREASFIAARDSFYMASVSETGWPYIQHRGGPVGFMKTIDRNTIAFANYSGNRQYVSQGNFTTDNRVSLFFMDYPNQRRLKVLGRVDIVTPENAEVMSLLEDPEYLAVIEHGIVIHIDAFDWNCPQHITPRYTETKRPQEISNNKDLTPAASASEHVLQNDGEVTLGNGPLELVVSGMKQLTANIRSFELSSSTGKKLPEVEPGSHVRLPVRDAAGTLTDREYSITRQSADLMTFEVAISLDKNGRGGSSAIHDNYQLGTRMNADWPINQFSLHDDDRPSILIAGGIGITPIRAMASALHADNRLFTLHYTGKSRRDMAFVAELEEQLEHHLSVQYSGTGTRLDIEKLIVEAPLDAVVYVCGPDELIKAVADTAKRLGIESDRIRFESFK